MPALEVADIFRDHGAAWRQARAGHLSRGQLQVMSAIERCRSAALGGHVLCCQDCAEIQIAYNSCRNRHCPKCQGSAARLGITAVLHTWGSALTHHPHLHCIVPGGGLSLDATHWVAARSGFFLPVRVLSRLFRRLFLEQLGAAHAAGRLQFFAQHRPLADADAFAAHLAPLRTTEWVVYAKRPFAGPEAVLAYLSRYTHRVAISNNRLIACDDNGVTFKWKDYRAKGRDRYKTMTLTTGEFIRRFLIHVLPAGFHRIRHYGLLANPVRAKHLQYVRQLLAHEAADAATPDAQVDEDHRPTHTYTCPACGAPMIIIETFERQNPRAPPIPS